MLSWRPKGMLGRRYSCIVLCVLGSTLSLWSQENDCKKQTVTLSPRDKRGTFISGLRAADLRAKIGGKTATILSAVELTNAHRLVLVLDASGSMVPIWGALRRTSAEIIRSSPESTQLALVIFAGRVLESVDFGHSRSEILSAINSFADFPHEGGTALRDSALYAAGLLQTAQPGDSVIVITDGRDSTSKASNKAIRKTYLSNGIRLFLLEIVDRYLPEQPSFTDNEFPLISSATGGNVISFDSPNDVPAAAYEMVYEIAHYYLVQIALSDALERDASLELEVVDPSGRRKKGVELTFTQTLLPCANLTAHP